VQLSEAADGLLRSFWIGCNDPKIVLGGPVRPTAMLFSIAHRPERKRKDPGELFLRQAGCLPDRLRINDIAEFREILFRQRRR
jgi:hypothetical protein